MKPLATRILAATISGGLAAATIMIWWSLQDEGSTVGLVNNTVRAQDLLESREASRLAEDSGGISKSAPSLAERSSLTAEQASSIFSIPEHAFLHDGQTYYRYKPDLELVRRWGEHPDGRWVLDTNSMGLREDQDTNLAGLDRFVLVAGDSHTDGMCNNTESFAQIVEAELRARDPEKSLEVLNTGTSGYNFFNYLGVLDKFGGDSPDTFVVAIYGGNDYLGNVMPQHFFTGTAPQPRFADYWTKLEAAKEVSSSAVGMALNQAYYFQHYPDEVEVARQASLAVAEEIQRTCQGQGIKLIWVYIPPLYDVDQVRTEEMDRAREVIGLTSYDMSIADRLTDAVLTLAKDGGNPVIDMRVEFEGREGPFYWTDGHINLNSHKLIAELLLPLL